MVVKNTNTINLGICKNIAFERFNPIFQKYIKDLQKIIFTYGLSFEELNVDIYFPFLLSYSLKL